MRNVIAIDGEGIAGRGYCLLQSSNGETLEGVHLDASAVFPWLIDRQAECKRLVAYGIDYDVCSWLRGLSPKALTRLASRGHAWLLIGNTTYSVTYRPGHSFTISRISPGTGGRHDGYARVLDAHQWTAGPMVDAAEGWDCCSGEVAEEMRAMKNLRSAFAPENLPEVRDYNGLECLATEELWLAVDDFLREHNLPRPAIQMPGAVASTMMRQNTVPEMPPTPADVLDAARQAFRGGRIQTLRFGRFGECSHFDLRSAYGWALSLLPRLPSEWMYVNDYNPRHSWGVYDVSWDIPNGWTGVRPFAATGSQGRFPQRGRGWFWIPMVRAGKEALGDHCTVHGGWVPLYFSHDVVWPSPFGYIRDLYNLRMSLPRDHPGRRVMQVLIAATWGKLAQGVSGSSRNAPRYCNPVWAGMVTSLVDARLYAQMQSLGERVIAAHVDGIWFEGTSGDGSSSYLGGWGLKAYDRLLLLSSGQYWAGRGAEVDVAQSGNGFRAVSEEDALAVWSERGPNGWITLHGEQLQTLRQVSDNGQWDTLGTFQPAKVGLRFNPGKGSYVRQSENVWHYKERDNSVEVEERTNEA